MSGPRCTTVRAAGPIESRITVSWGLIGPHPQSRRVVRPQSSLAGRGSLSGLNSMIPQGGSARSSLARRRTALGRANPAWGLPVRHYRVSHFPPETAEDNLELARGDRRRPGARARGLDVVLVVRAGDGAVLAVRVPEVLGVPAAVGRPGPCRPTGAPPAGGGDGAASGRRDSASDGVSSESGAWGHLRGGECHRAPRDREGNTLFDC